MRLFFMGTAAMLVACGALVACGDDGDGSTGTGGSTTGTGTGTGTGSGTETGMGGSGTGTETGTGGSGTGTGGMGGSASGGGGTGGDASGGGAPGNCPPEPGDDECTECIKMNCCPEATACMADAECSACLACLQTAPNPNTCFGGDCQFNDPETAAFVTCGQMCQACQQMN
ncbi:MAG: hypothetical protein RIF41_30075 [Polyangiaceae bacterium]